MKYLIWIHAWCSLRPSIIRRKVTNNCPGCAISIFCPNAIQTSLMISRNTRNFLPQEGGSVHWFGCMRQNGIWIGSAITPLATSLSLISLNLGAASIWLLFWPEASLAPLQRISAAAAARGQTIRSRLTGSVCSAQMWHSPPKTRCWFSFGTPLSGSYE